MSGELKLHRFHGGLNSRSGGPYLKKIRLLGSQTRKPWPWSSPAFALLCASSQQTSKSVESAIPFDPRTKKWKASPTALASPFQPAAGIYFHHELKARPFAAFLELAKAVICMATSHSATLLLQYTSIGA